MTKHSRRLTLTLVVVSLVALALLVSIGIWSWKRSTSAANAKAALASLRNDWGIAVPQGSMEVVLYDTEPNMDSMRRLTVLQPTGAVGLEGSFFDSSSMSSEPLTSDELALVEEVKRTLRRADEFSPDGDTKKRPLSMASKRYAKAVEVLLSVYEPQSNRFYVYERRW